MRFLLGLFVVLEVMGCAGNSVQSAVPFAGLFTGDWVSVDDPTYAGPSEWRINSDGQVVGTDWDLVNGVTYAITGNINANGDLVTVSVPDDGSATGSLNGRLTYDREGKISGILVWGVSPPAAFRYTFSRSEPH